MSTESHQFTNSLINESSPYLLQHAHNPVDWMPWGDEALERAKDENKPMLISIGYSACHWCHVMEHESFEDTAVARLMNENFVCIKVDREERPDVDQVYMDAVQLITGQGGWPLNCFALPDGRPFFGGTYFQKAQWIEVLKKVRQAFDSNTEKVEEYAAKLTNGINQMDDLPVRPVPSEFSMDSIEAAVSRWKKSFDHEHGGADHAPKFPLPNNYEFLLAYGHLSKDEEVLKHVYLTLDKMAYGGIYDQIGGGFARYSVDELWKVPHFEKMLYDNGQLLTLYSLAYMKSGNELYQQIVNETARFIERELMSEESAFYSALDADSEGEEGKFYIWTKDELKALAGSDFEVIKNFYNINERGHWEHGNYILLRSLNNSEIANRHGLQAEQLERIVSNFKAKAMEKRSERIRPGLDDKTLTSWNAMTSRGLVYAYRATGNEDWINLARKNLDFLLKNQKKEDGSLHHSYKNGQSSIHGYLEDYAHLIQALISFYEVTFESRYLNEAFTLANYVKSHFDQNDAGFFYVNERSNQRLIAKKAELTDTVIPASNSILAKTFRHLGLLFEDQSLMQSSKQMLAAMETQFARYPSGYSQWMSLQLQFARPAYELAIVGDDCLKKLEDVRQIYLPNVVLCGGTDEGKLPILQNRKVDGETLFYLCREGACQLPVSTAEEVFKQMGR